MEACLQCPRARPWSSWWGARSSRWAGTELELRSYILIHRQKENEFEPNMNLRNRKSHPSDTPPSTRPYLLIFPKQITNWNQTFKYMSLWETFSFKLPQSLSVWVVIYPHKVISTPFRFSERRLRFAVFLGSIEGDPSFLLPTSPVRGFLSLLLWGESSFFSWLSPQGVVSS